MLKLILPLLLLSMTARAQFPYNFSVLRDTYLPISNGTSVNNGALWDDDAYKVPIGFHFKMDDTELDSISLIAPTFFATDTIGPVNAIWAAACDMYDRGTKTTGTSLSPISYKTQGSPGNRIFKAEIANAGFGNEYYLYQTTDDSIYLQLWLYEESNIVEIRFGPSNVNYYSDYFYSDGHPLIGFVRKLDLDNLNCAQFYYCKGKASNPTIDSTTDALNLKAGLDEIPDNGIVYRFAPKPVSIKDVSNSLKDVRVYPTICNNKLFIDNNNGATEVNYTIYTINGSSYKTSSRKILKHEEVDISDLPPGFYILKLSDNANSKQFKFTKR